MVHRALVYACMNFLDGKMCASSKREGCIACMLRNAPAPPPLLPPPVRGNGTLRVPMSCCTSPRSIADQYVAIMAKPFALVAKCRSSDRQRQATAQAAVCPPKLSRIWRSSPPAKQGQGVSSLLLLQSTDSLPLLLLPAPCAIPG